MQEHQGPAPDPAKGAARLSPRALAPLVPPAPPPTRRERWQNALELALALLLNIIFLIALFYRPHWAAKEPPKEPPAISVQLVPPEQAPPKPEPQPKPEEQPKEQPQPEEKKPPEQFTLKGSGDLKKEKPGRVPKVEADKSPEKPQVAAKKPKPEEPKQTETEVPDWAKNLSKGYDLPAQKQSSVKKSSGSNKDTSLDEREGEGGGDLWSNQLREQILAHTRIPASMIGRADTAIVAIAVDRLGNLRGMRLLKSSGNRDFDIIIMQGVRDAAPFRPLPSGLPELVVMNWEVRPETVH